MYAYVYVYMCVPIVYRRYVAVHVVYLTHMILELEFRVHERLLLVQLLVSVVTMRIPIVANRCRNITPLQLIKP